mmetsp:Transcript_28760/g.62117  ORF Transcript_28760/g.62117 Transcript_28760/m.62117 type:complete len:82 (-) Transcript_28760:296-541(-)
MTRLTSLALTPSCGRCRGALAVLVVAVTVPPLTPPMRSHGIAMPCRRRLTLCHVRGSPRHLSHSGCRRCHDMSTTRRVNDR